MINEKIENSLKELEQCLNDVESARKQVESVVNAYGSLESSIVGYVNTLETTNARIAEIIEHIGNDYDQKIIEFETDRETIIQSSNSVIEKLNTATAAFQSSLSGLQKRVKYNLILNVASILIIGAIAFFLMK